MSVSHDTWTDLTSQLPLKISNLDVAGNIVTKIGLFVIEYCCGKYHMSQDVIRLKLHKRKITSGRSVCVHPSHFHALICRAHILVIDCSDFA